MAAEEAARHEHVTIIVNAERKTVPSLEVSYTEVVKLAYPTPPSPDTTFTVTYRNAVDPREGSLVEGQSVKVREEGTIFNVRATGKS
ncbi:MAG TPA: multiubiquitin domain-containing protein [Ktedonobacterales bacterium]|nr:multiubiquitin domain-containing protein [Ktedonobacterales bacterium]